MSKNKLFDMKTWFFTLIYWVDDGLNRLKVQIKQFKTIHILKTREWVSNIRLVGRLRYFENKNIKSLVILCKNHCGDSGLDYNCGISCFHFFILFICIFSVKKTVVWIMKKKSMSIKRRKVQREWLNTPDTLSSPTQTTQNQTAYNPGSYS